METCRPFFCGCYPREGGVRRSFDARHPWRAPLRGAPKRVQFRSWRNCREYTFMNDKTSEAGLLYCVHAAERVQRVLLHPGQQQALNGLRAWRAISKPNCGWLRPCTLGGFLLFGQKKATKEKAARMAHSPALRGFGSRVAPTRHPVAAVQSQTSLSAPLRALAQSLAVLGRALRGFNKTPSRYSCR
jgi:hypothetical protein